MKPLILFFCIVLIFSQNNCFSQCCAAGNPSCTNNSLPGGGKYNLDISVTYMHAYSDSYYKGIDKLPDFHYIDNSYFDFTSIYVNYGLTNDLKISAELGYFFDKRQNFDFGSGQKFTRNAYGLGDGAIGISYSLYKTENKLFEINNSIKVTLPIGVFDQTNENGSVVLPIDIQPSSGNFKFEMGVSFLKRFENTNFALLSYNTAEFPQPIVSERTSYYKYGNQYNLSLLAIYSFPKLISGFLQLRFMDRERAFDGENKFIDATGGVVLFISPQVSFNFSKFARFSLQYDQPVYNNMNGIQLVSKYAVLAKISSSIDFSQFKATMPIESEERSSLIRTNFRVEGLCSMCKDRIEKTVREFKNVASTSWNKDTKMLEIGYKDQPDIKAIKKAIANAGHDNESFKATDETYNNLPKCCKYRDKAK